MDETANEALRWSRSAVIKLEAATADLDLAIDSLVFERKFPSPEWRDFRRQLDDLIRQLEAINKG